MASFKTAYLQREVILDVAVKATINTSTATVPAAAAAFQIRKTTPASLAAILVGDLVKMTIAQTVYAYETMVQDVTKSYTSAATLPDATAASPQYLEVGSSAPYTYYQKISYDNPTFIERVLSLATATHIVAQSDATLEYGHVPIEQRDYRYFPTVNGTFASGVEPTTPLKKVALFVILNKTDVIIDATQGETI